MIELLEDTPILIVTSPREKILPLENIPRLLPIGMAKKNEVIKIVNPGEKLVKPANFIMPQQPDAYIKYPQYDFL